MMQTPEEKLNEFKKQITFEKDRLLQVLFVNDPTPLLIQPGLAAQLILGLRSSIALLKKLDDEYEFKFDEIPLNNDKRPSYV